MNYGITPVFYKNYQAMKVKDSDGKRKYKYIINTGSSRSSKTYSLIELMHRICENNSNFRVTAWRDTKKDAKDTIWQDFLKVLSISNRINYKNRNKTESYYSYENNTTFEIHGADDEEKVHGLTQNVAWLNEPYKISKDTFDQIDQRSDLIFIDWNPKKSHWIEDIAKQENAIVIHSTYKDNPFCPIESKKKIESYQPICKSHAVENKLISDQKVFDYDFNKNPLNITEIHLSELYRCLLNESQKSANITKWDIYGLGIKAEKPNRIFKWEPIAIQEYYKINVKTYIGVDWGKVDAFGIVEAKYYDGKLYLHELNYDSENKWENKLTPLERQNIKGIDEGFVTWLFRKLQIPQTIDVICDNNRPLKILALRRAGWERSISALKKAGSILDGIDILDGLEVYYTESSKNLEYEQENYSRVVDKYGVVQDEAEDMDNHLMDPTRYIALHLQNIGIIKKI